MTNWLRVGVFGIAIAAMGFAPQSTGSGSIAGVVTAAEGGQPIRRVTVTLLTGAPSGNRVGVTDDRGRFAFADLPAGRYTLRAERLGYVRASYGATRGWRSPGVPIVLAAGQSIAGANLSMMKGGVITGRVTDQLGEPLQDIWVSIAEPREINGTLSLTIPPANGVAGGQGVNPLISSTDDRGVYRFYGLPPGRFIVGAYRMYGEPMRPYEPTVADDAPRAATAIGYVPVYFPGTIDPAAATPIMIRAAEERGGVDFQIDPVRFATVRGSVTDQSGQPAGGVTLFAMRYGIVAGSMETGGLPPLGGSTATGEFTIRGVPPGRFSILAQTRTGTPRFAKADVQVDGGDVSGVTLQLAPGVTVSGRVVIEERATAPPNWSGVKVRVTAPPAPAGASIAIPPVDVQPDGTFKIPGVGPDSYVLSAVLPGDAWMVKSAVLNGRDLMTNPIDVAPGQAVDGVVVTLTDRVTEISGRLLDAAGKPSPDFYVLAFPTDRRLWSLGRDRLRPAVRPDANGHYQITGLSPGEYYLAALPDAQPNDFADPTFLEVVVPAALKIAIGEGEKKVQDVRLAGGS